MSLTTPDAIFFVGFMWVFAYTLVHLERLRRREQEIRLEWERELLKLKWLRENQKPFPSCTPSEHQKETKP